MTESTRYARTTASRVSDSLDPKATIEVQAVPYDRDDDTRHLRATVTDHNGLELELYQSNGFSVEGVSVHFDSDDEREPLSVSVSTFEDASFGNWAFIEFERGYDGENGQHSLRQSTSFIAAEELVEIRDALNKAIKKARRDGHIS
jgi:hypothetical protein